jgi:class 3 adenylate cyclase
VLRERPPEDLGEDLLIMFAAPVKRPDDLLRTTLRRLRQHNHLVTWVVTEGLKARCNGSSSGRILKYLEDGPLVAFHTVDADKALLAAAMVMMREAAVPVDQDLETRIGLSVGPVCKEHYVQGAPEDLWGEPIEIAARLVSDVAMCGQIVLDDKAREAADLKLVRTLAADAGLFPIQGVDLSIRGVEELRPVAELNLDGEKKRKPQNHRRLAHELAKIKLATLDLRIKIKDEKPDLSRNRRESDIATFAKLVRMLHPEQPRQEASDLKRSWDEAIEAPKQPDLARRHEEILEKCSALQEAWEELSRGIRAPGPEGRGVGGDCLTALEPVSNAIESFSYDINDILEQVEREL